ncbi:hypothetical protein HW561_19575 [Rhodobacteraceae bacterium B1Z28]|uniref:Uncharacterized protein n=1 Tax=Ruegeria haliotis TaxID=2747601 RepID=A0ABX2PUZ9_9RHOB|nr:hypothetical protein [Ruegeria haliotis]NVO58003.1 hypothetical protein [Ruegeria haliotis]
MANVANQKEQLLLKWLFEVHAPDDELVVGKIQEAVTNGALPDDRNYKFERDFDKQQVLIQSTDKPLDYPFILPFLNPLALVKAALDLFGREVLRAKYLDPSDTFYGMREKITSFANTYVVMVMLVQNALNEGYGLDEAAALLSSTSSVAKLLWQIGAIETEAFDRAKIIGEMGLNDSREIKVKAQEIWAKQLSLSGLTGRDVDPGEVTTDYLQREVDREFVIVVRLKSVPGKKFVREDRKWRVEDL